MTTEGEDEPSDARDDLAGRRPSRNRIGAREWQFSQLRLRRALYQVS
jgi:hypothetical protein